LTRFDPFTYQTGLTHNIFEVGRGVSFIVGDNYELYYGSTIEDGVHVNGYSTFRYSFDWKNQYIGLSWNNRNRQATDISVSSKYIDYVFENKKWNKNILSYDSAVRDSSIIFYEKGFNNVNFKSINTKTKTFLILNGGGPVLQIEKDKIIRIDNSVEQKNQFGAAIFEHNNQLHMSGGYGFWTFKEYTTYFDTATNQWELCVFDSAPNLKPRWKPIFHKTKNNLYVLGGRASLVENQLIDAVIKDVFKIDSQTKSIGIWGLKPSSKSSILCV
jgi:hypothetical protein